MIPGVRTTARIGIALIALIVSAWFGLGFYQARETGKASALIGGGAARLSQPQVRTANAELSSAGTLNPDRMPELLRGELAADQHHYAAAIRILQGVTAHEPLNVTAWAQLGLAAARAGNRQVLAVAGRHVAVLIPPVKPARTRP
jgi:cytochrome c-type biogenesis protein CcmH/NrfG